MKKFIALILALALAFSLAACGNSGAQQGVEEPEANIEDSVGDSEETAEVTGTAWDDLDMDDSEKDELRSLIDSFLAEGVGPYKLCVVLVDEAFFESWDDAYAFLENSGYDWYEIALAAAEKSIEEYPGQSVDSVVGGLIGQGFTKDQANYAGLNSSISTGDPAVDDALSIIADFPGISPGVVAGVMIKRGYSEDEALDAAYNCGADWNEQALLALQDEISYWDEAGWSYTRDDLYAYLTDGSQQNFTHEQAEYALSEMGF